MDKFRKNILIWILLSMFQCSYVVQTSFAQEKGKDAKWESAGKVGVGTALSEKSKVWFTLEGGSLTEVFYPTADKANVQVLQFIVVNRKTGKVETERDDAIHRVNPVTIDSLAFQQINTAKSNNWRISKIYWTDPNSNTVLIDVKFETKNKNLDLYVYYDPSLGNSGMNDNAWNEGNVLLAKDGEYCSAIVINAPLSEITNGFSGIDDGLTQLKKSGKIINQKSKAGDGNIVQVAKINSKSFLVSLGFGKNPEESVKAAKDSQAHSTIPVEFIEGWSSYVKTLLKVEPRFQEQLNYSAMVLRAFEDKTYRGGNVASLSKPWISGNAANGEYVSGYHLVWSRDLYQVITAYMALGDKDSANRALDYLFKYQHKADGSYPQMTWIDGRVVGDSQQMDEVAYPLILAYQLGRNDKQTYEKYIKSTANFIVKTGPTTKQERWEERPGYSPATIAAEIAGLVCAADIATKNGDENSAKIWLETADNWAKNVDKWTATTKGKYGDGNYYLRLTKNGTPDAGDKIELNNGAGTFLESEVVDAGFLELVRLGIKSPNDPLIVKSLRVVDEVLKVKTPNGDGFYRYTNDGYGEYHDGRNWNYDQTWTGKGHLWALLSGERGQYELALGNFLHNEAKSQKVEAYNQAYLIKGKANKLVAEYRLESMSKFANDGMMIPEQVWSQNNSVFPFGEGARSATPLAWSMAQFIRLAVNLKAGKNLDTPEVVAKRYGNLK